MSSRPFLDSSDAAKALDNAGTKSGRIGDEKYPWRTLPIGKSFQVNKGEAAYKTILNSCYKWSKKLNKKFRAIDHGDLGIEVTRLSDPPLKSVGNSLAEKLPDEYKEKGVPQFWGDKSVVKIEEKKEEE